MYVFIVQYKRYVSLVFEDVISASDLVHVSENPARIHGRFSRNEFLADNNLHVK